MAAESQTSPQEDTAPKEQAEEKPASLTKEDLSAATQAAVKEALAVQAAENQKHIEQAQLTAQEAQERLAKVTQALSGKEESKIKPLAEALLRNPDAVLDEHGRLTKQETKEEILAEIREQQEIDRVVGAEYARRAELGVPLSDEQKTIVNGYYLQTDPNLPFQERYQEAMNKFDNFMDSVAGQGDFESRVKAAASASTKNASASSGPQESDVDWAAKEREELEASASKFNRAHNIIE